MSEYRDGYHDGEPDERPSFPWRGEPCCNAGEIVNGQYHPCADAAIEVVYSVNRQAYMLCPRHYAALPASLDLLRRPEGKQ